MILSTWLPLSQLHFAFILQCCQGMELSSVQLFTPIPLRTTGNMITHWQASLNWGWRVNGILKYGDMKTSHPEDAAFTSGKNKGWTVSKSSENVVLVKDRLREPGNSLAYQSSPTSAFSPFPFHLALPAFYLFLPYLVSHFIVEDTIYNQRIPYQQIESASWGLCHSNLSSVTDVVEWFWKSWFCHFRIWVVSVVGFPFSSLLHI